MQQETLALKKQPNSCARAVWSELPTFQAMPFPMGLTKADSPSAWPSLPEHSVELEFEILHFISAGTGTAPSGKVQHLCRDSAQLGSWPWLLAADVEKAKGDHTKGTHLQSILMHPLEKQRAADWLPGRRQKEISKGRIYTEVLPLRLKDSSPKPTRPSVGPLRNFAPSASKNHEKFCNARYSLCTADDSHLHLRFSYACAMMLRDRSFPVKYLG